MTAKPMTAALVLLAASCTAAKHSASSALRWPAGHSSAPATSAQDPAAAAATGAFVASAAASAAAFAAASFLA
eukprot:scaffold30745_cov73-Phaeocystis_antarctica.AAC.1